jgi:hypothetical protein
MVYPNEGYIQIEISLYCYIEDWPMANLAIFNLPWRVAYGHPFMVYIFIFIFICV